MKRIILFFAVCLGLSVSQTTFADNADSVRAAAKRTSVSSVSSSQSATRSASSGSQRSSNISNTQKTTRTNAQNQSKVVSRTTTKKPNVTQRATTQQSKNVTTTSRKTATRNVNSRNNESEKPVVKAVATRTPTIATKPRRNVIRAADLDAAKIENIKSLNYSKCKSVYYECMDEFCANKDSNLRRCACSSRIHEFDNIKKQLANAEDKMLDFNQRLLTVSLDKEDAAAINVATEGELAFNKKDTTESEKLLQKITKTLNNSGDSRINNNISSISLSLDMDNAWDNIDSVSGIATSSKNGVDLYNAAQPICIEMAKEVCNDDELKIAQSGYKLTIQQDCDTVAKSYKTQYNNAKDKIYESGALLDMSRLNVYQQRNSDDTLTCRKKILEQLSDNSVCGENLYKCLDTTGQYIDPSNGSAFLSENLHNLTSLLSEPSAGEKWSTVGQNESFVKFLNSKKDFLKPAVEQCRDISDMIWKEFLDDALAQIKLAQNAKIEEVKRSCTQLVADCKTTTLKDLSDFDARALSSFSVSADKTVNAICSDVMTSCANLMNIADTSHNWETGMTDIAHNTTIKTVIEECTNVGRNCIIQQCNATSGNFALCQSETSDVRARILLNKACYNDVSECIANADGMKDKDTNEIKKERDEILAQIWGGCDKPRTDSSSQIKSGSTLLSWFATNTGLNSCNATGCENGYKMNSQGKCEKVIAKTTSDNGQATSSNQVVYVTNTFTNYCENGVRDMYENCCAAGTIADNGICVPYSGWHAVRLMDLQCTVQNYLCPKSGNMSLYCVTDTDIDNGEDAIWYYSDSAEYECRGEKSMWVMVDENGNYFKAYEQWANEAPKPVMYYQKEIPSAGDTIGSESNRCEYKYEYDQESTSSSWIFVGAACEQRISTPPTTNEFLIRYDLN